MSYARSPLLVCSITMGTSIVCGSLHATGHTSSRGSKSGVERSPPYADLRYRESKVFSLRMRCRILSSPPSCVKRGSEEHTSELQSPLPRCVRWGGGGPPPPPGGGGEKKSNRFLGVGVVFFISPPPLPDQKG